MKNGIKDSSNFDWKNPKDVGNMTHQMNIRANHSEGPHSQNSGRILSLHENGEHGTVHESGDGLPSESCVYSDPMPNNGICLAGLVETSPKIEIDADYKDHLRETRIASILRHQTRSDEPITR